MDYFQVLLLTSVVFLNTSSGTESSGIHIKIHAPEIIRHHIHTKTIYIHLHELKAKIPKSQVDDWTSYSSYNYNSSAEDGRGESYERRKKTQSHVDDQMPNDHNSLGFFGPPVDYQEMTNQQTPQIDSNAFPEPGQYAIHENVEESPVEAYKEYRQEDYHRGMKTEKGHVYEKDLRDFYDNSHDEGDYSRGGYEDQDFQRLDSRGMYGNYNKEIGPKQRMGNKRADRRVFVAGYLIK